MKFKNTARAAYAPILIAAVVLSSTVARAQDPELVTKANSEAQVVVYGDLNAVPALAAGFQKKYPSVKVVSVTGDAWQMYNRFMTEKASGRPQVDVFFLAEDVVKTAEKSGGLATLPSEAIAGLPPAMIPSRQDKYALGNIGVMMLAWNQDAIGKVPLPNDWLDFANPPKSWNGLVGVSDPSSSSATFATFAALYQHFGPDKAATILHGLRKIKAELTASIGVQNTKVQTGERPLAFFMNASTIAVLKSQGTPISFRQPKSGAIAQSNAVAISAQAPHPNAARLFVDFALGNEGQRLLVAKNLYAVRPGLPPPQGMPALDKINFMPFDLGKALDQRDAIINWWRKETGFGPR